MDFALTVFWISLLVGGIGAVTYFAIDFALVLFCLLLLTGTLWVVDFFVLRKHRAPDSKDPWWVEFGSDFFPVILLVFVVRSFIVEPFKIPSGSMIPTLLVGDFILVNKYTYGIRLPILDKKVIEINQPQRGDVMVFRYPVDPSQNYIKRVVGVPGDKVAYQNKQLTINGEAVTKEPTEDYLHSGRLYYSKQFSENLNGVEHRILNYQNVSPLISDNVSSFPHRENCLYNNAGVVCTVPEGHYFMMGDNRDDSTDSRYWGFVPDENIVGKAFFIWFNFDFMDNWKRIGSFR